MIFVRYLSFKKKQDNCQIKKMTLFFLQKDTCHIVVRQLSSFLKTLVSKLEEENCHVKKMTHVLLKKRHMA
jgi:hypothetical protein